jgi:hypothetical protein
MGRGGALGRAGIGRQRGHTLLHGIGLVARVHHPLADEEDEEPEGQDWKKAFAPHHE